MAYRRSIVARSKLFYQQHQRFSPSLSHISGSDHEQLPAKRNPEMLRSFLISSNNAGISRLRRSEVPAGYGLLSGNVSRLMRSEVPTGYGQIFHRNMSKVPLDIEAPAEDLNGVIGVVADKAVEAAPMVNEVATAAAGSTCDNGFFEFVQILTGLEWWASIVAGTLFVRLCFALLHARSLQRDDDSRFEFWTLWLAIEFHIIYSIVKLVENVPSLKTGGILWFTDLTTPNRVELPILCALTFWASMKLDPERFIEGEKPDKDNSSKYVATTYFLTVAAGFPPAFYLSWITTHLFQMTYGTVVIHPRVQKMLGISLTTPHSAGK